MGTHASDATPSNVLLPASGETVNSQGFNFPRGGIGLIVHVPTLASGGDTVKLQSLANQLDNVESETWRDVKVFNLADGSFTAIAALPSNSCTTLPLAAIGGGVFRWVASADQSASPVTIRMNVLITR